MSSRLCGTLYSTWTFQSLLWPGWISTLVLTTDQKYIIIAPVNKQLSEMAQVEYIYFFYNFHGLAY